MVVVAIIGVTLSVGLLSFSLVVSQNLKGSASDLHGQIAKTRVESLSRSGGSVTLTLSTTASGFFAYSSVERQMVKLAKPSVDITYKVEGGNVYTLGPTDKLVLSFDKSSGAFMKLPVGCDGSGKYCEEVIFSQAGRSYKVVLIPQTGKYFIEGV